MKKSLLAGASVIALILTNGAQAADLKIKPVYKAPGLAPAPWSWTGFYIGGHIGVAWGRSSTDSDVLLLGLNPSASLSGTGVIGGIQAGVNWQFDRFRPRH